MPGQQKKAKLVLMGKPAFKRNGCFGKPNQTKTGIDSKEWKEECRAKR